MSKNNNSAEINSESLSTGQNLPLELYFLVSFHDDDMWPFFLSSFSTGCYSCCSNIGSAQLILVLGYLSPGQAVMECMGK